MDGGWKMSEGLGCYCKLGEDQRTVKEGDGDRSLL